MRIRNLTPHDIVVGGKEIWRAAQAARVVVEEELDVQLSHVVGFDCYRRQTIAIENLPPEEGGVYLIVSAMVRAACPDRKDLLSPGTGKGSVVRDAEGKIVGVNDLDCNS